ncbi:hypothetical protein I6A84_00870 [Frankia sp. CNm7]|uniref:Uncharacterized protein n=1 Tax=Frankia nepalensis TaxID=1836974 RepID=A0A937RED7_9ACTN|nr:hypothetical protein [Frankia nepalensis]MBL7496705.1 hypothetical protein [Frankia nepalensis]MBL7511065.1 hypothetical protein [Frankia nepalensis]MBL7516713.1 hypothetical protein [Frankia nepalensis]MBL7627445.1 hypothetical protein [Frankia nepalensis]
MDVDLDALLAADRTASTRCDDHRLAALRGTRRGELAVIVTAELGSDPLRYPTTPSPGEGVQASEAGHADLKIRDSVV